jgi:hypothetical protein
LPRFDSGNHAKELKIGFSGHTTKAVPAVMAIFQRNWRGILAERLEALVQIGGGGDFGRDRCVDPDTDQAANAACQIS